MTTKHNALERYKKSIRLKYEKEKIQEYSSFLLLPSRAKLRQLCVERLKEKASMDDLKSFSLFFGFEFGMNSLNKLQSQTDKFRPIETFLKGETDLIEIEGINIAALLVDYNPRPFNKFIKSDVAENNSDEKENNNKVNNIEKENLVVKSSEIVSQNNTTTFLKIKNNKFKKIGIGVMSLIGIFSVGYTSKDLFFAEKECMQWQKDHYVLVDCKNTSSNLTSLYNKPEPYDEKEFHRRKLIVCDTTTFFVGEKPIVWYSKKNNVVEFFNMDGINPENGDELKQISQHMIDKYVKPCE